MHSLRTSPKGSLHNKLSKAPLPGCPLRPPYGTTNRSRRSRWRSDCWSWIERRLNVRQKPRQINVYRVSERLWIAFGIVITASQ